MSAVRNYVLVTAAYWAFTLTDGALRMLVLLHFHELGYSAVQLAFLFVLYELCGIVTNLVGGWLASQFGLRITLLSGLGLQVAALIMLGSMSPAWSSALSVAYVMGAQSLSGIAKDLTKMSAKSSIKVLVADDQQSSLFKWVAILTGSKNALKGVGFFLGGALLSLLGYAHSLFAMAGALALVLVSAALSLPRELGHAKRKSKFKSLLSTRREVNILSAARFFLFGARDIWFVVGVPVFLAATLGFGFTAVGSFLALWVIGYGITQSIAPAVIGYFNRGRVPGIQWARVLAFMLAACAALIAIGLIVGLAPRVVMLSGLAIFGVLFAMSSSVHSYLILAYSERGEVAKNVGFYYMANAGGRLTGTLLSGLLFEAFGVVGCLWGSAAFALAAGLFSSGVAATSTGLLSEAAAVEAAD